MCITEPGDAVLIPAPYYPAFDNDLRVRNGAVAVPVCGDDAVSLPTPTQLDEAVEKARADGREVKAILLTNPSNPLGASGPIKNATPPNRTATHPTLDHVIFSSVVK